MLISLNCLSYHQYKLITAIDSDTEELLFWRSLGISVASIVIAAVRVILGHEELKSLTSHWQLVPLGMLW